MPSFTYEQMSYIVSEHKKTLEGGMIQKIHQPQKEFLLLQIRKPQINHRLFFCLDQQNISFYLTQTNWQNPPTPLFFCQLLRKHILNARIVAFNLPENDRSLSIEIQAKRESFHTYFLLFELWGRCGNAYLLDQHKNILGSLHPTTKQKDYFQLVTQKSTSTKTSPKKNFLEAHLPQETSELMWNEAADAYFSAHLQQQKKIRQLQMLSSLIKKEQKKLRNKIQKLQTNLEQVTNCDDLRICGELLKSNMHLVKRGDKNVQVINYFSDSGSDSLEIQLDPRKSAKQNMQSYFKRYRKLQSARPFLEKQMHNAQQKIDHYEKWNLLIEKDKLPSHDKLPVKWQNLLEKTPQSTKSKEQQRDCYYKFTSQDDLTILVGRGSRDNDQLTFQVARGNDMWMHTEDYPGAHVVIINRDKKQIPQRTLFDAAQLAGYYSKAKNHPKISIAYTHRKNVSKPKKAKPGLVYLSSKKNLFILPDQELLAKLLETKR